MIFYLCGFLVAVFLPLFVSSWRVAILGIALQGLCIAFISFSQGIVFEPDSILRLVDLVCLRFIAVPVVFFGLLRHCRPAPSFDLIPANLVTWILSLGLLILGLNLGHRLHPEDLSKAFLTGAVACALLVGLLILSVQIDNLGQMVGLLYIESGITLFETLGHQEPWFIQIALSLLFLWLLGLMGRFSQKFIRVEPANDDSKRELNPLGREVL